MLRSFISSEETWPCQNVSGKSAGSPDTAECREGGTWPLTRRAVVAKGWFVGMGEVDFVEAI